MTPFRTIWIKLRTLWQRSAVKREIDEELRFHLEQRTTENIAGGMAPEAAAREARKRFGNVQSIREECRETRGASFGEATWQDIRFGLRMLRKNPGFATVAALTVGLGIGANAAMFSLLKPLLFHPLPYPNPGRLVRVYRTSPRSQTWPHSRADFLDYHEQNHVFSSLAAYMWEGFNFGVTGQTPERFTAVRVTADLFPMLGIQPELGRIFSGEDMEPGRNQVTVLSHGFWRRHFAGDTNVIGRTFRFDDEPVTVIGVMSARFDFPMLWGDPEVWRPFVMTAEERGDRGNRFLNTIGRLKPGVSLAEARADMTAMFGRLARDYPQYDGGSGLRVLALAQSLRSEGEALALGFVFSLTSFVLLIACANLANLQLARTTRRSRELAVRAALGAARQRLMRQLLTESLLISLFGGGLGLLFAWWCDALFTTSLEAGLRTALDFHVVFFALASCVVTTIIFGAGPAWLTVRADLNQKLKDSVRGATSAPGQQRLQHVLIIGEVALVLMLLTGAGAAVRTLQRFVRLNPGWDPDGLVTAQISVSRAKYSSSERRLALFQQIEDRATALPGVQSASFTTDIPILRFWNGAPLRIGDQPPPALRDMPLASCPTVGAAYFQTLRIALHEGRRFTPDDKLDRPLVVIINESLARAYWPGQSPLGKRISLGDPSAPEWREIVGVVSDVRFPADGGNPETPFQVYRPWAQDDIALGGTIVLRIAGAPESVEVALRRALAELDPDLPLYSVSTVRTTIDSMMRGTYRVAGLLGAFGVLGLLLAAVGTYGVTSYSMARRTGEIGIRMALGAQKSDVLWLVMRQGLRLGLLGALLGIGGAFAVLRILVAIIPARSPMRDPVTLLSVPVSGWIVALTAAAVLIGLTILACYLPARRAANVSPMTALRYE
ncbi:MAG: ABC transporter permease [Verrucomicrobiota bacterium]|jgi:predicted permease